MENILSRDEEVKMVLSVTKGIFKCYLNTPHEKRSELKQALHDKMNIRLYGYDPEEAVIELKKTDCAYEISQMIDGFKSICLVLPQDIYILRHITFSEAC